MVIRILISPCLHRSQSRRAQRPARGFAGEAGVIGAAFVRLRCAALLAGETFPCCNPLKSPEMGLESRETRGVSRQRAGTRGAGLQMLVEAGGTRGQKSCRNPLKTNHSRPETALIAGCAFNRRRRRTLAVAQIGRFGARGIFLDLLRCIIDMQAHRDTTRSMRAGRVKGSCFSCRAPLRVPHRRPDTRGVSPLKRPLPRCACSRRSGCMKDTQLGKFQWLRPRRAPRQSTRQNGLP
jgi:hypothetical protein